MLNDFSSSSVHVVVQQGNVNGYSLYSVVAEIHIDLRYAFSSLFVPLIWEKNLVLMGLEARLAMQSLGLHQDLG